MDNEIKDLWTSKNVINSAVFEFEKVQPVSGLEKVKMLKELSEKVTKRMKVMKL